MHRTTLFACALVCLLRDCRGDDALGWDGAAEALYSGVVMVTHFDQRYASIAAVTLPNKLQYCRKHGVPLISHADTYVDENGVVASVRAALGDRQGLLKCGLFREVFRRFPNCSWAFHTDTDVVITNLSVPLSKFTDGAKHLVAAADLNAPNAGSFFLRNSEYGRAALDMMCASTPLYKRHGWAENQYLIDMYRTLHFKATVMTVLPQRSFNSYDYQTTDILGTAGQWQPGDFMVHFAGVHFTEKLRLARRYAALSI